VRRISLLALATLPFVSLSPAPAQAESPAALQQLLDYHAAACAGQGGTLSIGPDAISQAFLNGPENPAALLDSSQLICTGAPTMFCGEGVGCELNVFVGDAQHSLIVLDWTLVPDDDRQLLQVTIAAALVRRPNDLTTLMTWDSAAGALVTVGSAK
jgi:hypothetical protein